MVWLFAVACCSGCLLVWLVGSLFVCLSKLQFSTMLLVVTRPAFCCWLVVVGCLDCMFVCFLSSIDSSNDSNNGSNDDSNDDNNNVSNDDSNNDSNDDSNND